MILSAYPKISATKCIICKEPSNGKHFCRNCYFKYKEQAIDIRIKNCIDSEIIDNYGNKSIQCKDGRKVRSRAEKIIADYLFDHRIRYSYERTVYYTKNGETKELHPDFYLHDYDLYIEYNERTDLKYIEEKKYAMTIYRSKQLKIIVMTADDIVNIDSFFFKNKISIR